MICSKGCNLLQSIDLYLEKYNTLTYFKTQFFKFNDCFFTHIQVLKVAKFHLGSFRIFIFSESLSFFIQLLWVTSFLHHLLYFVFRFPYLNVTKSLVRLIGKHTYIENTLPPFFSLGKESRATASRLNI